MEFGGAESAAGVEVTFLAVTSMRTEKLLGKGHPS